MLCFTAMAGLVAAFLAHQQIQLWVGSKGVVVAHAGENWLELVRLLGPAISCGAIYLAWRSIKRQKPTISENRRLD
jgi:hypothetical protein